MNNEKIMELSVQLLCALINNGFVPPMLAGKGVDTASGMVRDYLDSLTKEVEAVYLHLEQDDA